MFAVCVRVCLYLCVRAREYVYYKCIKPSCMDDLHLSLVYICSSTLIFITFLDESVLEQVEMCPMV